MQRTRILYIGPKKSGKSTLFYHMKFGTAFKGIYPPSLPLLFLLRSVSNLVCCYNSDKRTYYLRKFGTVVSLDLALAPKSKKPHTPTSSPAPPTFASPFPTPNIACAPPNSTLPSHFGTPEPHGSDILPADLEVHDVEDFEVLISLPLSSLSPISFSPLPHPPKWLFRHSLSNEMYYQMV
jgi:hypothetical protein